MFTWTKMMALVTVALSCGMTIAATNARAEDTHETAESAGAIVNVNDDDFNIEPSHEDAESRLEVVDRDWHRRGYRACYSYCDELRDNCIRRYDRGYDDERRGDRHHDSYGYRRCERRFDFCIEQCRDTRWRNR